MPNKTKILVELSGGVDSAATAYLLKEKGYDCIGAMMLLHSSPGIELEINSAKNICKKLDIPFKLINLENEFKENVIKYFIDTYIQAKTPNPCIECNKKMKFGIMFDFAEKFGCTKIATGHYAQIIKINKNYYLKCAKDNNKDQSYVLSFLNQNQLSKIEFPLGAYTKEEVRKIAEKAKFECAKKDESQDICFVQNNNYKNYILENSNYIPIPGNIVSLSGKILGTHNGLINYTVGQRKGLGLAFNEPKYVTKLNNQTNQVVLGSKEETITNNVEVIDFNWILGKPKSTNFECLSKLRYRQKPCKCECFVGDKSVKLYYKNGISAVTPGQFAVLYEEDKVIGGGLILQ